jgi:tetrahydromethanopterin S-methyltransferase subunit G
MSVVMNSEEFQEYLNELDLNKLEKKAENKDKEIITEVNDNIQRLGKKPFRNS